MAECAHTIPLRLLTREIFVMVMRQFADAAWVSSSNEFVDEVVLYDTSAFVDEVGVS